MNPEVYAEWLRRQGQRVVQTASTYWHSEGFGVYQAFPFHWVIQPSKAELLDLMLRHNAIALRYSTPSDSLTGVESYHVTYTKDRYDCEMLPAWTRKNVRRGLHSCNVTPISVERYANEGWVLRIDTLARQGRRMRETRGDWIRKCEALTDLPGFEIWAAQVRGRLAATLLVFQMGDWGYMVYQQCHRDYLREHVNNALSFIVTQHLVRRPGIRGVFYGMRSLDAPASVDEFKFRMGYDAGPVRQSVVFHPCVSPLVRPLIHRIVKGIAGYMPSNRPLSKAEGLLRICLAGRSALNTEKVVTA